MEYTNYKDLPSDELIMQVYPNLVAMITGVTMATQDSIGNVTLHYTDGTKEVALCDFTNIYDYDYANAIEAVQGQR